MSYARFGPDSSVYVFMSTQLHLECCGCALHDAGATICKSTNEMLAHLRRHVDAGHKVPQDCIDRLKERQDDNDAILASSPTEGPRNDD